MAAQKAPDSKTDEASFWRGARVEVQVLILSPPLNTLGYYIVIGMAPNPKHCCFFDQISFFLVLENEPQVLTIERAPSVRF